MEFAIALLADAANVSQEGKLNILGTFDRLFVPVLPTRFRQSDLVLRILFHPSERGAERELKVILIDEDANELSSLEATLEIPADTPIERKSINLILALPILVFERYGRHELCVSLGEDARATIPLEVMPPLRPIEAQDG